MAEKFETLEEQLERFIENTRQMGIIVSDFQPQGQNALNQKLYVDKFVLLGDFLLTKVTEIIKSFFIAASPISRHLHITSFLGYNAT